ncbi:MAG TPA: phosphoribosyl-AMP cyclohydrolase [Anaerolineales bacterium]|nr:phosphoribosyl-AMP cyclohydrolase [Anaerolineales bacterium]
MDDGKKSAIVVCGQWSIVDGLEKKMNDALLSEIKFDANGLVPAIVQDAATKDVLMMAWMNTESLRLTLETGETVFWSRSRQEIWHKGATSGNVQKVVEVRVDCDADTLLVLVEPAGPACHTGERSCFFRSVEGSKFKVES